MSRFAALGRKAFLALAFSFLVTCVASADSITIGSIQYLGTTSQGAGAFKVTLNTSGISVPLTINNAVLSYGGASQSTGILTTPTTLLFIIDPKSGSLGTSLNSATFQLSFGTGNGPVTVTLANGQQFTVKPIDWTKMFPLSGQNALLAGQSVPITLTSVPEPGTLSLFGAGLLSLGALYRRGKKQT